MCPEAERFSFSESDSGIKMGRRPPSVEDLTGAAATFTEGDRKWGWGFSPTSPSGFAIGKWGGVAGLPLDRPVPTAPLQFVDLYIYETTLHAPRPRAFRTSWGETFFWYGLGPATIPLPSHCPHEDEQFLWYEVGPATRRSTPRSSRSHWWKFVLPAPVQILNTPLIDMHIFGEVGSQF
jgi:hypothetical protein